VTDAGSTGAGSSDNGSAGLADNGSSDNGSSVPGSADASAADAAAAAAAAAQAANNGNTSVFPVGRGSDNDRNGSDNSPVTGGGNRDLWTGSEDGSDCPPGKNTAPACGADQGARP
jgi:hypothetical protein